MAYQAIPSTAVAALTNIYQRGADLGDASVTIQPFTDRAFFYVMPQGTRTANRTITLGNTSFYNTAGMVTWCGILMLDTGAFTLTIKKADTTTIYTDPVSPAASRLLMFACDNTGVWAAGQPLMHIAL